MTAHRVEHIGPDGRIYEAIVFNARDSLGAVVRAAEWAIDSDPYLIPGDLELLGVRAISDAEAWRLPFVG